ncbi:hypothetical protein BH11ACT6_BH11ACT6_09370 [soil metagenome]
MTARTPISAAAVAAFVLAGALAMPAAHADDPLAPIRASVNQERAGTVCPALTYSGALEAAAQALVRAPGKDAFQVTGYDGTTVKTWGFGDPQAEAISATYGNGAWQSISNCAFSDFGVGFIRNGEEDTVGIVFGAPRPAPMPPGPDPNANPTLTPVPAAEPLTPPKVAPTNAVQVSFTKGLQWTVNVTSTADIAGTCTYSATNPILPGANRSFTIEPRGTASFTVLAPPPLSVYHVVVSCSGPFDGKTVEFGRFEQDVRA